MVIFCDSTRIFLIPMHYYMHVLKCLTILFCLSFSDCNRVPFIGFSTVYLEIRGDHWFLKTCPRNYEFVNEICGCHPRRISKYMLYLTQCEHIVSATCTCHRIAYMSHDMLFQTMWHFDMCILRRAPAASF